MIEKMHRLSLLLFYTEKKRILRGLQELGVVDLDLAQSESPRIRRAAQDANELKKSLGLIEKVRKQLPQGAELPKIEMPHESGAQLELVRALLSEKEHLENAVRELSDEYARYSQWGEIPVDGIAMLAQKGIGIHLFSGSEKFFDRYDFGEYCVEVISRGDNTVRFVLVTHHEDAPVIPFQKYAVPGRSLSEMQAERQYLGKKLNLVLAKIAALSSGAGRLQNSAAHLETRRLFETAKHSLEADKTGSVFSITGYFPESSAERVKRFLESHSLAYEISQPAADDQVPVRLKNNWLSRLFEPVTQIFSLPDYRELDPTPLFAPFFTLFFGFCMGDVGYGFLLLLVSFVLMSRRSLRGIGLLVLILSAATIVSGVLMNSFFGANLFVRDGQGLIAADKDPAIFAAYTIQGKTVFPAMALSLLVGCAQIFIAFVLQSLNETLVL
ncbi:MAG TPA: V-type ATPase 116kDa subunit family protein, partial [Turneriella sp.]|nr:V-type ATPase 116kDa subunit family protein [Turneriella sp.]